MLSIIVGMADRYARCAAVLYRMFRELDMIKFNKDQLQRQWHKTMQSGDSVAMITWYANKFNFWSGEKYLNMVRNATAREIVPDMSGRTPIKIMSPDGETDWTNGRGINDRDDKSSGIDIRMTDALAKINPTDPLILA